MKNLAAGAVACSMILCATAAQASVCEPEWRHWGELEARAQGKTMEQLIQEGSRGKTLHQVFLQFVSFNTSIGGLKHVREIAEIYRNGARTEIDRAQGALWACMADNYDNLEGASHTQQVQQAK